VRSKHAKKKWYARSRKRKVLARNCFEAESQPY
jgi:hypothetical protein